MNVIFTCGGTGGHINPAIAVANIWKERYPQSNILFVGGTEPLEKELIPKAGYQLVSIPADIVHRGKSLRALRKNIKTVATALSGVRKCKKLFREFKPDVIVGMGGYASFPALLAGHLMKIPTLVHESNAMPGMTTRLAASFADRVLVCFPESVRYYKNADKVQVVGMPVRREFIYTKKEEARRQLGLDERPLIVSAFGSQGAKVMNETMAELFRLEKQHGFAWQHIHAVGSFGMEWMPELVRQKGIDLEHDTSVQMRQYIYDMPLVMAAADVVIGRAGASTCNEIAASGTPCILIPSPNVTDNHQEKNARALARSGGAVVVLEKDCTAQAIYDQVQAIVSDPERQRQMEKALYTMVVPDSAEQVCRIMEQEMRGK